MQGTPKQQKDGLINEALLLDDELLPQRPRVLPTQELRRAVRHYRRAIMALESSAFDGLSEETETHLLDKLSGRLDRMKHELSQRETKND